MIAHLKGTVLLSAAVATAIGAIAVARKIRENKNPSFAPLYPDTTGMSGQGEQSDLAPGETTPTDAPRSASN